MFLKDIQKQPKHIRIRIFITLMSLAFIFLVFFWVTSMTSSIKESSVDISDNSYLGDLPTITDSLKASFSDVFSGKEMKLK